MVDRMKWLNKFLDWSMEYEELLWIGAIVVAILAAIFTT